MFQVLGVARRPAVRVGIVAATLSATMVFGGTALARLPGHLLGASDTASAARVTSVTVLGKKAVNLNAGQTRTLLKIGAITTRAVCTNLGGSTRKIDIQIKTSTPGALVMSQNGALALTSSYQSGLTLTNTAPAAQSFQYDVLIGTTVFTHYNADYGVYGATDCGVRLAALSD